MEERLIANIIYRELFSYNTVFLQNIGFLSLVDHSASLSTDGSTLRPPYRTVAAYFVDEQIPNSVDIVMALCQAASVDYSTAYSMYNGYIQKYLVGNVLSLPYVMQLKLDDMCILKIDDRMRAALENQQLSPLVIRENETESHSNSSEYRRTKIPYKLSPAPSTFQLVLAIIVVTATVLYLIYIFILKDLISNSALLS